MKKISIKTIDGSRYDFSWDPYNIANLMMPDLTESIVAHLVDRRKFLDLPVDDKTMKWFNVQNIVSITETEQEE